MILWGSYTGIHSSIRDPPVPPDHGCNLACTVGANDAHPAGEADLAADVFEDHGSIIVIGEEHIPAIDRKPTTLEAAKSKFRITPSHTV